MRRIHLSQTKSEVSVKATALKLLTLSILLLLNGHPAPARAEQPIPALATAVAEQCGSAHFDRIESLRFTFNVEKGKMHKQRRWVWSPATDTVTLVPGNAGEQAVSYRRIELTSDLSQIDSWFVNDSYWLLFPLHLVWDEFASLVADDEPVASPLAGQLCRRLVANYPSAGGYTPGDAYELYINDANQIVEWVYRRGAAVKPTRLALWRDYATVGPLQLSLDRPGDDGNFRVWFTDVAVRVKGSDQWVDAKPGGQ